MRDVCAALLIATAGLLAGCAAAGGWAKPGADEATMAGDYRDCRTLAADAVRPEIDINQDILATRQNDWQRAQVGQVASATMQEETRRRAASIVASCMQAKGYARSK